jgi:hypothetical protein
VPIGSVWGAGTWADTAWAEGTWADAVIPEPEQETGARGGWLSRQQIRDEEDFQRDRKRREKELLEEIALAYDRLHGESAPEIAQEAAKIVAPYVEGRKPKKALPAPARIDFPALSRNIEAATKLLKLYEEQLDDEEAANVLLSVV